MKISRTFLGLFMIVATAATIFWSHAGLAAPISDARHHGETGNRLQVTDLQNSQSIDDRRTYVPLVRTGVIPRGTVVGRVTNATDNLPITDAQVCVLSTDQCATTSAQGDYSISQVPAGDQSLGAMASGFILLAQIGNVPVHGTLTKDFQLLPNAMYGRVINMTIGQPIPDAQVCVLSTNQCTTTDSQGMYSIHQVPNGNQSVRATASGFVQDVQTGSMPADGAWMLDFLLSPNRVTGRVINATNGQAILDAHVCVLSTNQCATTDAQGNYFIDQVPNTGSEIRASADGFYPLVQSIVMPDTGLLTRNFPVAPNLEPGEIVVVLTWGQSPSDIDAHLWLPPSDPYHVYYGNRGNCTNFPWACLNVDDVSSYGPETITVQEVYSGIYTYGAYNYSGSPAITTSEGVVRVYQEPGLVETFEVPTSGSGRWWYVFDIDGSNGAVITRNVIRSGPPGPYFIERAMGDK